ncbi:MAG: TolC family protein [Planctomycetes bacterium]|nr:TolC family protein [Planctomycetota bacterium]
MRQVAAQVAQNGDASVVGKQEEGAGVVFINLPAALQRAGLANATVAFADELVRQRQAEELQARALLFPNVNVGANVRSHRGTYLRARGNLLDADIQSTYAGLGAGARGAGPLAVPGVLLVSHLADAVYAPRAARQKVAESRSDANATRQYTLLEVGVAYLALAEAQARLTAYEQSRREFGEIERLTTNFVKPGQGRDADAKRAISEALLLQGQAQQAREALGVAAADLARLLDLDPSEPLRAADGTPPILELVNRAVPLPTLLDQAFAAHPEIAARTAEVAFQQTRLRQERVRPFLPLIAIGFSAGDYAGSGDNTISRPGDYLGRTDLDVVAVWSLQNLGAGNLSVQRVADANLQMARLSLTRTFERVRQEVAQAHALVAARRQELVLARRRIELSRRAYEEDLVRVKNNQGRPLEVLASARQLAEGRQSLVRAMIGYSQAQLQLFTALGNTP